ncbi:MAG: ABC transporter substrate-binding protein [Rhodoplanes sp.]|uniref:TAXI family TRAP transporter solute-binding subunit n=1 Tax=Rhodoplanes sp. TaxID=1968906 RepID=UPI0017E5B03C|nr:TAXI family TRAP transporter solute-binding subunit [Rhodoplanes sp.]NVO14074.1 ABC transporter substrate-binding protein [Rhodoplanes sp.]
MEQEQLRKAAIGAAVIAALAAVATGRLPRWLRIVVVFALVILAGCSGLYVYRHFTTPKTLTLATGSADGDMPRFMSAIAARMAANGTPVRLKVVDKGNVLEAMKAFSAGEVDLTVGRGDVGDLSEARSVVAITNNVVLIVTPPGSPVKEVEDLKGKTVGVVGGVVNHQLVEVLKKEYELDRLKVTFKDLPLPDIATAFTGKHVAALLVVMPITERYLSLLRSIIPNSKQKPGLIAIEAAGAIAEVARAYESWDLPKGTLRGSPPIPDDDLTTLRVPFYLLAKRKLDDDTVATLAKAIMETRRELIGEFPILAQISAPSTDKDAFVPIHPGAAAYFDGDTKTFFDKYGDQIFYGSMLLGSLTSLFAAAWKFMAKEASPAERSLARLCALSDRIDEAADEATLTDLERQIDGILRSELDKIAARDPDAAEPSALTLATYRLERLIALRRARLRGEPQPPAAA